MRKYVFAVFTGIFIGTVVAVSQAAETRNTVKKHADGSTEVCKYETDFAQDGTGANIIRTDWRCVRTPVKR
jgi:hypothetical protein